MKKLKIISQYNIIILILFTATLLRITYYENNNFKTSLDKDQHTFIGYITSIEKNKITIKINQEYLSGTYNKELNNLNINDLIKLTGTLTTPSDNTTFNLFNYKDYLYHNKQYYLIDIENIEIIKSNNNIFYTIKNNIRNKISKYKGYPYLNAFILGNNKAINNDIKNSFQNNNISHLFAVSGMHITLFTEIINKLLNKIFKNKSLILISIILFLLLYTFLINFTPSGTRTFLFFTINQLNKKFNLKIKPIKILFFIFLLLLCINPFYLYNLGFIYSFTISFSLIYLNTYLNKSKNYFLSLIKVSLISFITSSIITIYNTYELNLMGILYNLLFVPLISICIFPLSLIHLFINISFIYNPLIAFLEKTSLFINNINIGKLIMRKPNNITLIILIIFIILTLTKIKKGHNKWIIIYFIVILLYSNSNNLIKETYITMIDVNQGDSTLIYSNNDAILIDTGGSIYTEYATSRIIPYLKSMGIKKIKYLILTHGDIDHMGEAINLVNNFKVENVIFNIGNFNDLENKLIEVLEEKEIKYYKDIKELKINNNKLYFLNTKEYDNENDNSNVIYLELNNYKFLFMGDAGTNKEKDILDKYNLKDIDFIKIGHHGSNTSSSKSFIDSISPKNCLISVGKNNRYGHPKESVLDILNDYCDIYRTDLNGSIEIKINKNNYKIKTYSP